MNSIYKKNILLISNANCDWGRIGERLYDAFKREGYYIDYLTLYPLSHRADTKHIYPKKTWINRLTQNLVWKIIKKIKKPKSKYCFFNYSDNQQPISLRQIRKATNDMNYDIVITYFWQFFLTPVTIREIYYHYKCKIFFSMADFAALAGGCHYYCDCDRYTSGCGNCPGWNSNSINDVTKRNSLIRKQIYKEINPIITGNSYMQKIYAHSFLLNECTYMTSYGSIDLNHFKRKNIDQLRLKYNIPIEKTKILFFGCQSIDDPKKGISILLEALKIFYNNLNQTDRDKVLLLIAGRQNIERIKSQLPFGFMYVGFVGYETLPEVYSLATCFLSPSINDAGPSMVNQSLACGTPVIAFNTGIAQDCIVTGKTGYKAKLGDPLDFATGISNICGLSTIEYKELSLRCRNLAENLFSIENSIKNYQRYF